MKTMIGLAAVLAVATAQDRDRRYRWDEEDLVQLVQPACCPADIAGGGETGSCPDGEVDFDDLLTLLMAMDGPCGWDCPPGQGCRDDVNRDCSRDEEDLLIILASWGPCGGGG